MVLIAERNIYLVWSFVSPSYPVKTSQNTSQKQLFPICCCEISLRVWRLSVPCWSVTTSDLTAGFAFQAVRKHADTPLNAASRKDEKQILFLCAEGEEHLFQTLPNVHMSNGKTQENAKMHVQNKLLFFSSDTSSDLQSAPCLTRRLPRPPLFFWPPPPPHLFLPEPVLRWPIVAAAPALLPTTTLTQEKYPSLRPLWHRVRGDSHLWLVRDKTVLTLRLNNFISVVKCFLPSDYVHTLDLLKIYFSPDKHWSRSSTVLNVHFKVCFWMKKMNIICCCWEKCCRAVLDWSQ